jgi:hypothetical protein
MTLRQHEAVAELLERRAGSFTVLHHGDCVGGDAEVHEVGRYLKLYIIGHPPLNPRMRAWRRCDELRPPKDYIARNHDIVDECEELVAAPHSKAEEVHSGTWATVRYARKQGKLITIVFPDGSFGQP